MIAQLFFEGALCMHGCIVDPGDDIARFRISTNSRSFALQAFDQYAVKTFIADAEVVLPRVLVVVLDGLCADEAALYPAVSYPVLVDSPVDIDRYCKLISVIRARSGKNSIIDAYEFPGFVYQRRALITRIDVGI